jgi:hypothetical protein
MPGLHRMTHCRWQPDWERILSHTRRPARPNFRSDSLISMVYQNPRPAFASPRLLGFECRPFKLAPGMLE